MFDHTGEISSEKKNGNGQAATTDLLTNDGTYTVDLLEETKFNPSTKLQELLTQLNLTENDLTRAGIDLKALEFALNPTMYGKVVNSIMTFPTILPRFWPWIQKGAINNSQSQRQLINELTDLESNHDIIKIESPDLVNGDKLENEQLGEKLNLISTKKSTGKFFESKTRLDAVFGIKAFNKTAEKTFMAVWGGLVLSLVIQGTLNYYKYPDEQGNSTVWDALGFSTALNVFCIKVLNLFCVHAERQYAIALASALDMWPAVVGFTVLVGVISGTWASLQANILDDEEIAKAIKTLREHEPSFWVDSLSSIMFVIAELLAVVIPEILLIRLLPQSHIRRTLEKIRNHLIWDGRLDNKQLEELFQELLVYSEQRTQLTQLKVLTIIAEIVQDIEFRNLKLLQEQEVEGIKNKTLRFIKIKLQGLEKLHYFANYNLPDKPPQTVRPLLRYLFANYLLWTLSYPKDKLPQLLFYIYKAIKIFFWLMFFKAAFEGVFDRVSNYIEGQQCNAAGKVWLWYEAFNKYICSACGDLPIDFQNIFTVQNCFLGYLNVPRTLKEIETFINRFDLSNVTDLELLEQTIIFQRGELPQLLDMLKIKLPGLKTFGLGTGVFSQQYIFTTTDVAAASRFIKNSSIETFYFGNVGPEDDNAFKFIGKVLPDTILRVLNLYANSAIYRANIELLADGARNHSTLRELNLGGNVLNKPGITAIANILPYTPIENLNLYATVDFPNSGESCSILAKRVPDSKLSILNFDNPMDSICLEAFASAVAELKHNLSLYLCAYDLSDNTGYGCDSGVNAFAQALKKDPAPLLTGLIIPCFNISQRNFLEFLHATSNSQLNLLNLAGVYISDINNLTVLIPDVVDALNASFIIDFTWNSFDTTLQAWGNNESNMFFSLLPEKLRQIINLDLTNNNIDQYGIPAIADSLANSGIQSLTLTYNNIRNILRLAIKLNQTNLKKLILESNRLTTEDAISLGENIKDSKLQLVDVSFNAEINDTGVLAIVKGAQGTTLTEFDFDHAYITDKGMEEFSKLLITDKIKHPLWIDFLKMNKGRYANTIAATNLSTLFLDIGYTNTDKSLASLCAVLPFTNISMYNLNLDLADNFNLSDPILSDCGIISSGNKLSPHWSLLIIPRSISLFSTLLSEYYKLLTNKKRYLFIEDENNVFPEQIKDLTFAEVQSSIDYSQQRINIFDLSTYQSSETIVINLDPNLSLQSSIDIPVNTDVIIGSHSSNHVIIGNNKIDIDLSQNYGNNLLIPGENNLIYLGSHGEDHILIRPDLGIIQILNFNHRDVLHILDEQTLYTDSMFICREINFLTVLKLRGTEVQFTNTNCEIISEHIKFNNQTAFAEAQTKVFQKNAAQQALLNHSLFGIFQTFLNSLGKSAVLSAIPKFITELFYRYGGFTRKEAEAFGREIQFELMLFATETPEAISAGFLAAWVTSRFTHSPSIISMANMGVTVGTSMLATLWKQEISLLWLGLHTGTALVAGGLTNVLIENAEQIASWGWKKASEVKQYTSSYFSFWTKDKAQFLQEDIQQEAEVNKGMLSRAY